MAAGDRALRVVLTGDTRDFERAMKRADRAVDDTDGRIGKFATGAAKGIAGVAAVAGGALVAGLAESAKAAMESERVTASLKAQLDAVGLSYADNAKQIDDVIAKQSALSALDDEDLQRSFTNIVRVTKDVNEALELNALAADIARARNMDVAKAGELVAKVAAGQEGALRRYGVQVKEGATAQEALAAAQQKFGGQAEAYGKTTEGAAERAKVAFGNLKEGIGAALLPTLTDLANKFAEVVAEIQEAWPEISATVKRVVGQVQDAIGGWVSRNRKDIDAVIAAFRDIADAVRVYFHEWILPTIRRALPGIKAAIEGMTRVIGGLARIVSGVLSGDWSKVWQGIKDVVTGTLKAIGGNIRAYTAGLREAASRMGEGIKNGITSGLDGMVEFFTARVNRILVVLNDAIRLANKVNPLGDIPTVPLISTGGPKISAEKKQAGGMVGGSGRGDIVPALLEPGEFVIRRQVVERFGPTFFNDLNNVQGFRRGGIVDLGRAIQGMGYAVGEHPAFGGVRGRHAKGSWHYRAGALDVNADSAPGGEAAALDSLAATLRAAGWPVLWRTAGHFDHLHVDLGRGPQEIPGTGGGAQATSGGSRSQRRRGPASGTARGTGASAGGVSAEDAAALTEASAMNADAVSGTNNAMTALKRQRLAKIDRALKRNLSPRTRARLLAERAGLVNDLRVDAPAAADVGADGGAGAEPQESESERRAREQQEEANRLLAEAIEAQKAQTAAIESLNAQVARQNNFNESLVGVQIAELSRAFGDLLAGQIGGSMLAPRAASAGAGTVVRY